MTKKQLVSASSALALVFGVHGASAQGLEEITVTARKTAESIMSVPLAVTAITAKDLADRGVRDPLFDVAIYTPGFTFQNQSVNRNDRGFKTFVVRGIVPSSPNANRQAATIFLDGAPINGGNIAGVTDIERVEVVKGPQSAYFGRATFAGAVNFITRAPGDEYAASTSVDVATYGTHDISISGEGPIVKDKLSLRVTGRTYHTQGQYTNREFPQDRKLGERDTKSFSVSLAAHPTDSLSLKGFVNAWKDEDGPPANAQLNNLFYNCSFPGAASGYYCGAIREAPESTRVYNTVISQAVFDYLTGVKGPAPWLFAKNFLTHHGLKRNAVQANLSFDYTFGDGYVISGNGSYDDNKWAFITDTTFRDTRNIPNANFGVIPDVLPYFQRSAAGAEEDSGQYGELRLTSPRGDRFKWMAGVNYAFQRNDVLTNAWGVAGYIAASPLNVSNSDNYGVFGSVNYELGGGFSITGEGRLQWDKLRQEQVVAKFVAQATYRAFTPRVILDYKPNDDLTIYASYAEGTRPGEFNTQFFTLTAAQQAQVLAATSVGLAVPEERMRMGEVGLKGNFLDNRLRLLADVYYGDWKNRHVPNLVNLLAPNGSFQQTIVIQNTGGQTHLWGLELEGAFQPTPELTLEGTFNIAASKIIKTYCTDCRTITFNPSPVGTQLPAYPKYKGTLSATYQREVFGDVTGFVRADYIYTGKIYDTEANVTWLVPSHKINLHVGLERGNTRFEIYGKNITDNRVPTSLARNTDGLTGFNAISLSLADKASYGLRLSQKF